MQTNTIWKEKSFIAEVSFPLIHHYHMLIKLIQAKQRADIMIGHKAKQAATDAYQVQFEFTHWAEVLSVARTASGPALAGHMAQYNNTDLTVCHI